MRLGLSFGGGCVCLLLALTGCNSRQQAAVEFNNQLTDFNQRLEQAQMEFFTALNAEQALAESKADKVRTAHDELVSKFEAVAADAKQVEVPDSPSAHAFYDALQKYLDSVGGVIRQDYQEMLDVLGNSGLNAVEKESKLQAIAKRADETRDEGLAAVETAQVAFAKEFGLELTNAN